ncbi:ATP-binding protein [Ectobacillus sp. sgz5001026]|uniref:ATP-binding protein n=1 Tax=Ectobacillus sp. sgz5001026 TaxID=3242473 RepID=UPI0036D2859B
MNEIINPMLMFIAIILTVIASFTSFDLLVLMKSTDRNKRFLFLGSIFSMGIGIWVTNFFGVLARDMNAISSYHIFIVAAAAVVGVLLTGVAYCWLCKRDIRNVDVLIASFIMTVTALLIFAGSMYGMNVDFQIDVFVCILSGLMIFFAFFASLWMLFRANKRQDSHLWLKPLGACLVTASIIESHFLLMRATIFPAMQETSTLSGNILMYMMLFASILILGSLVVSTTIISKRLTVSDTYLRDFQYALDASSIVAITDPKGTITFVNDKFVEISKYSRPELLGQNHSILNSGEHPKEFFKDMWRTIGNGKVWHGEIRNRAKDGTLYWVDTTIIPFLNENNKPYQYLAIRNDITERKRTEEMLRRQDKLAAIGQMAAGIAHEIRNPLTSVKGYTEFLQLDEHDDERNEYLSIILDEVDRVNEIVEDFLVLAKPKVVQLKRHNVVAIVQHVLALMQFDARKKGIRFMLDFNFENILVDCDESRLKQVFLNFLKNGMEAMPGGGEIRVNLHAHSGHVHISIQDTGLGIPKDKLKKIGEPFFTTKKNGNGLGLMVSFKIIEGHNGKIVVDSEMNIGTTFTVILPVQEIA